MNRIFLPFLLTFVATQSSAQQKCVHSKIASGSVQVEICGIPSTSQKESLNSQLNAFFDKAQSIIPRILKLPLNLIVKVDGSELAANSEYDNVNRLINLGQMNENTNGRLSATSENVFAHELGHAILDDAVASRSISLKTFLSDQRKLNLEKRKIDELLKKNQFKSMDQYNAVLARYDEISLSFENSRYPYAIYLAYQEFFADVFAVTMSGNPAANRIIEHELSFARDFSEPNTPAQLKRWKSKLSMATSWGMARHFAFGPARWQIWKLIEPKLTSAHSKSQVLAAVFSAVLSEIERTTADLNEWQKQHPNGDSGDYMESLDVLNLNMRLSEAIKQQL